MGTGSAGGLTGDPRLPQGAPWCHLRGANGALFADRLRRLLQRLGGA